MCRPLRWNAENFHDHILPHDEVAVEVEVVGGPAHGGVLDQAEDTVEGMLAGVLVLAAEVKGDSVPVAGVKSFYRHRVAHWHEQKCNYYRFYHFGTFSVVSFSWCLAEVLKNIYVGQKENSRLGSFYMFHSIYEGILETLLSSFSFE